MESEPPEKKPRLLDGHKCIICSKPLGKLKGNDKIVKNPTLEGISTILKIAHARKDEVFDALSPVEDQLRTQELKVSFHKSCRAAYTSSSNNYKYMTNNPVGTSEQPQPLRQTHYGEVVELNHPDLT